MRRDAPLRKVLPVQIPVAPDLSNGWDMASRGKVSPVRLPDVPGPCPTRVGHRSPGQSLTGETSGSPWTCPTGGVPPQAKSYR